MKLVNAATPWKIEQPVLHVKVHQITTKDGYIGDFVEFEGRLAASYLIKAVNCHEELVKLLKDLRECTLSESGSPTQMTMRIDEAIARAEGKE